MISVQDLPSGNLHRGLLASGFWNYLREDITFSLFENCPLKMDLTSIPPVSKYDSDQDYLNSITLILGKIINAAFRHSLAVQEWDTAFEMVRQWSSACPKRLGPFSKRPGGPGTDEGFPQMWFLQPCHGTDILSLSPGSATDNGSGYNALLSGHGGSFSSLRKSREVSRPLDTSSPRTRPHT